MTRPDWAFTYSQLSKFVQAPGPVHLAAAERALAYLRGTYNEGITYCDPGEERRNKLTGWVDSDFAADPDMRKSMTGYLFSLNGGAVSWRSSGVTLRSAEAAYLRALLRGFNFRQVGATEIWEPKAFLAQPLPNIGNTYMWGTRIHFSAFDFSFQDWTAPDGVLQYHHTMRIPSRTRRLRKMSSVSALTSHLEITVWENKTRPGRRPSPAVHHFGNGRDGEEHRGDISRNKTQNQALVCKVGRRQVRETQRPRQALS
jgi:hypothetical protein